MVHLPVWLLLCLLCWPWGSCSFLYVRWGQGELKFKQEYCSFLASAAEHDKKGQVRQQSQGHPGVSRVSIRCRFIDRQTLWKLLRHFGIPKKITSIIQNSYEGMTCRVVLIWRLTEAFQVKKGVRQGCLLSHFLFLLCNRDRVNGEYIYSPETKWHLVDILDTAGWPWLNLLHIPSSMQTNRLRKP